MRLVPSAWSRCVWVRSPGPGHGLGELLLIPGSLTGTRRWRADQAFIPDQWRWCGPQLDPDCRAMPIRTPFIARFLALINFTWVRCGNVREILCFSAHVAQLPICTCVVSVVAQLVKVSVMNTDACAREVPRAAPIGASHGCRVSPPGSEAIAVPLIPAAAVRRLLDAAQAGLPWPGTTSRPE